jgi:hypothetical protein
MKNTTSSNPQLYTKSDKKLNLIQTTIYDFISNCLTPLRKKFETILRLKKYAILTDLKTYKKFHDRVQNLYFKIFFILPTAIQKYITNCYNRFVSNDINNFTLQKNIQNTLRFL